MTIFLILLFIVILGFLILTAITSTATNNVFKKYLLSIGDEQTSQWLGFLRRPIIEVELMMEKKYEQTKNETYLSYGEKYRELAIRGRILSLLLFGVLVIYVITN